MEASVAPSFRPAGEVTRPAGLLKASTGVSGLDEILDGVIVLDHAVTDQISTRRMSYLAKPFEESALIRAVEKLLPVARR